MEIKPFIISFTFWDTLNGVNVAVFILGLLGTIIGANLAHKAERASLKLVYSNLLVSIGFFAALGAMMSVLFGVFYLEKEAYTAHVAVFDENLAKEGFKVISGDPDLHLNTQSSMLLSYNDKSFDCTVFSPKDSNTNVVFSCGESKLSLAQIKEG